MRELVAFIAALRWVAWRSAASLSRSAPRVVGSSSLVLSIRCLKGRLSAAVEKMERRVLSCSTNMARTINLSGIIGFSTASKTS